MATTQQPQNNDTFSKFVLKQFVFIHLVLSVLQLFDLGQNLVRYVNNNKTCRNHCSGAPMEESLHLYLLQQVKPIISVAYNLFTITAVVEYILFLTSCCLKELQVQYHRLFWKMHPV